MKQFACSIGFVSTFCKTHLKRFDLRMMVKVIRGRVAAGFRSKLSGEDSGPRRSTEYTSSVGIGEIHASRGQAIHIRCERMRCSFETTDPVVHVVNCQEEDIGFCFGDCIGAQKTD